MMTIKKYNSNIKDGIKKKYKDCLTKIFQTELPLTIKQFPY